MNKIVDLITKRDWYNLIDQYEPQVLAKNLSFKEGRSLAYKILFDDTREKGDDLSNYAVQLIQELRKIYSKEWSEDWRNDVFLGDICYMTMKYEERFKAYKRAYERALPPPPSLLISLASCYLSPIPPITLNEAENLAKKALENEMSIEGVILLRGIYAEKKDQDKFNYWDTILREIEKKNIHIQDMWPDFSDSGGTWENGKNPT